MRNLWQAQRHGRSIIERVLPDLRIALLAALPHKIIERAGPRLAYAGPGCHVCRTDEPRECSSCRARVLRGES